MEPFVILGWIVWTVVNGMIANEKGRSVGGVVAASLFLSPLTAYLYLLAVPAQPRRKSAKEEDQLVMARIAENTKGL
jgi:hypothetical protein